jgi:chorismate synthase
MRIEKDQVEIVAGVRHGKTLGGPIGLIIQNKDWENWQQVMAVDPGPAEAAQQRVVTKPRPGHADLVGAIKYGHQDIRNVLEKASARETAIRVAVGAVAKEFLAQFDMSVISHVVEIGGIKAAIESGMDPERKLKGDTLGGVFEVVVTNPPIGLGSYSQWDRRLNARLAMALMSIQAIKGVEIGLGFEVARRFGSEVHDEIFYNKPKGKKKATGFYRRTNNAGGVEGGVTNGQNIILRAAMKPIATLYTPLKSVDIITKEPFEASVERSDVCSVPAAGVVGEAVVAFEMAGEIIRKFGGDSLAEMKRNYDAYLETVKKF